MAAGMAKGSLRLTVLIPDISVRREQAFFLRVLAKVPGKSLIFPPWHTCLSLNQSFCPGGLDCSDWLNVATCLELPKPHRVAGYIFNIIICHPTCLRDLGAQYNLRILGLGGEVGTAA